MALLGGRPGGGGWGWGGSRAVLGLHIGGEEAAVVEGVVRAESDNHLVGLTLQLGGGVSATVSDKKKNSCLYL